MQRLFSMFPAGVPGVALLLLRNCIAAALLDSTFDTVLHDGRQHTAFLILLGMLVIGMFTPLVCGLASAALLFALVGSPHPAYTRTAVVVLFTLSLAGLGPGAFSFDARIFGRRILISTSSSTPTKNEQP